MNLQPPPGFPVCSEQQPDETIPEYAARVLRFLLACQTTASMTDDQLTQADHAAQLAISQIKGPDGKASSIGPVEARTIAILSAARHSAIGALTWRREQQKHAAAGANPPAGGQQPGRLAPLQPTPPQLPPAEDSRPIPFSRRGAPDGIRF